MTRHYYQTLKVRDGNEEDTRYAIADVRVVLSRTLIAKTYHLLALPDHDFIRPRVSPLLPRCVSLSLSLPPVQQLT